MIVRLMGGLGNQMFQYAFGKSYEIKNNVKVKYDISFFKTKSHATPRKYALEPFNISENIEIVNLKYKKYLQKLFGIKEIKVMEKATNIFDPNIYKQDPNGIYIGYWQTEKYFKGIRKTLLYDFTLKNKDSTKLEMLENEIKNKNSISIHIRRGDYINDKHTNEVHGVCSLNYYKDAIKEIEKDIKHPFYFIFTDDPKWAKEKFIKLENSRIVSDNNLYKDYEEMYLMSLCKHNIIANSSFSWWGAWLNQNISKKVIAPKRWFTSKEKQKNDIIPDSWIKI